MGTDSRYTHHSMRLLAHNSRLSGYLLRIKASWRPMATGISAIVRGDLAQMYRHHPRCNSSSRPSSSPPSHPRAELDKVEKSLPCFTTSNSLPVRKATARTHTAKGQISFFTLHSPQPPAGSFGLQRGKDSSFTGFAQAPQHPWWCGILFIDTQEPGPQRLLR